MLYLNIRRTLLIAVFMLAAAPALFAQTIGNRADIVNKKWRIIAMKCPDAMNTDANQDQFVHYYGTLTLTPSNYQNINYGTFVKVHHDASDNPIERGNYSLVADDMNGTRLILKSRKGETTTTYRVELVYPNHLTLINLGDDEKCKVTYAIAP
ncbi:MAG: hypothetical protein JSS96_15300 [Bacteroidetes bacterium]|nr:hypothetical protein [Bacteroidota bacterium]